MSTRPNALSHAPARRTTSPPRLLPLFQQRRSGKRRSIRRLTQSSAGTTSVADVGAHNAVLIAYAAGTLESPLSDVLTKASQPLPPAIRRTIHVLYLAPGSP